ncbi:MAG: C-terminal binding protein [Aureliella sp.]
MAARVVVTDFIHEPLAIEREVLEGAASVTAIGAMSTDEFLSSLDDSSIASADALMVYHFVSVPREAIEKLPNCRLIVRCGAGFDNVDIKAARDHNIDVANVPDYGTEDVADAAIALTLSLMRGTHRLNQLCQQGTDNWKYELVVPLHRVRGQVFGVVGMGRIGTATALRAKALGMDVVFYDPNAVDGTDKAIGVRRVDTLAELLKQANAVSCHCLLNDQTQHIIDASAIAQMQRGSFLVNTSRGGVVDVLAVLEALESGRLGGAGIDVLEHEPPAADHPLIAAWRDPSHPANSRLILTPHSAFYSEEGLEDMRRKGSENVRRVLAGEAPRNVVNA